MSRWLSSSTRRPGLAFALLGGVFAIGLTAKLALAQETKCYLMVCTGSVCVAHQIECPKPSPEKPAPPPE
jgi:hypothetical protein